MTAIRERGFWLVPMLAVLLTGCRVVEETAKLPGNAVTALVPGAKTGQPDPAALQAELQRFSDEFASRTILALDDYSQTVGTAKATNRALVWKVSISSACVSIASGPNPTANLLDFLALATITRTALEEEWLKSSESNAFQSWFNASGSLEKEAWAMAEAIFKPEQQEEVRQGIRQWWISNSGSRTGFFARPQEFTSLIRQTGQQKARSGSVFAVIGLDPTAGLDPAVREVTRTRLFAERALYAAQRMPFLLRWQIELLASQTLQDARVAAALADVTSLTQSTERLSRAVESISQTAALLPDRVSAERKAILDATEAQEGKLRDLSAEVGRTLTAGERMSTSLNTTIGTFDALMKRFGVGEPSAAPPDTNAPPFNILDYARTADQIATMAQQLDALIKDTSGTVDSPGLDKRIAEVNALVVRAQTGGKSVLNHAFLLAAGLIVLTFACAAVCRRIGRHPDRRS